MLNRINPNIIVLAAFSVMLLSCKKKGSDAPAPVVPVIKIEDASQTRSTTASVMHFNLTLNKSTTVPVSVDYTLIDGSATAPRDYTAASGTITIPANQVQTQIDVQIKADPTDTRQNNLEFTVQISNAKACAIGVPSATGTIITENGSNLSTDNTGYSTPMSYPGYTLAWHDEFSTASLDMSAWNQESGNGTGGWGNNELEFYTTSTKNTFISNGNLIIEARKEAMGGFNYTSGRMTTQE